MPISGGMSEKQVNSGVCCWMNLEDMSWISQSWRDKYWVDGSIYIWYIYIYSFIVNIYTPTYITHTHTEYLVRFSDTTCGGCAWNCRKGTWGIRIAWVSLEKMTVLEMGNEQCGWAQHTTLKMIQMTGIMCVFHLNGKQPDGVIWNLWVRTEHPIGSLCCGCRSFVTCTIAAIMALEISQMQTGFRILRLSTRTNYEPFGILSQPDPSHLKC